MEFSSNTRRRLQMEALSGRAGGWISTLCSDDTVVGPVDPAAAT
ncbi:hypothetical protein L843_1998 [Mycobacterium intracellulare MIN_061107_1834]|nr:hypothetical protein L843_1998 [Mycobacterium intracellulare MIN_061107_1834]